MKYSYVGFLPKIHLWIDLALLNISFALAFAIRFDGINGLFNGLYLNLLLFANLLWIFTVYLLRVYSFFRSPDPVTYQFGKFVRALLIHAAAVAAFLYLIHQGKDYSRKHFVFTYSILMVLAAASRLAVTSLLATYRQSDYNRHRYAIIGTGEISQLLLRFYTDHQELGYQFCGMIQLENHPEDLESLETLIRSQQLDYIYCYLPDLSDDQIRSIIRLAERQKTQVRLFPHFDCTHFGCAQWDSGAHFGCAQWDSGAYFGCAQWDSGAWGGELRSLLEASVGRADAASLGDFAAPLGGIQVLALTPSESLVGSIELGEIQSPAVPRSAATTQAAAQVQTTKRSAAPTQEADQSQAPKRSAAPTQEAAQMQAPKRSAAPTQEAAQPRTVTLSEAEA